jgi:hypothetical protein
LSALPQALIMVETTNNPTRNERNFCIPMI